MILHAKINEDGTISAHIPKELWGKAVILSIKLEKKTVALSQWKAIQKVFDEADKLEIPRKNHDEILAELRAFKETTSVP